jgi:hypothetical protein
VESPFHPAVTLCSSSSEACRDSALAGQPRVSNRRYLQHRCSGNPAGGPGLASFTRGTSNLAAKSRQADLPKEEASFSRRGSAFRPSCHKTVLNPKRMIEGTELENVFWNEGIRRVLDGLGTLHRSRWPCGCRCTRPSRRCFMQTENSTETIETVYCPHCHLATPVWRAKCIHCKARIPAEAKKSA